MAGIIIPRNKQFFTRAGQTLVDSTQLQVPLNGGFAFVYLAGTSTKASIFSDAGLASALTNPITLTADGRSSQQVWVDNGSYKIVIAPSDDTDPPASAITTDDNIAIGLPPSALDDFDAVRAFASSAYDGQVVGVTGNESVADGGEGMFIIGTFDEADDGGVTLATGGSKKARRIYSGRVDGDWFSLSEDVADEAANLTKLTAIIAEAERKNVEIILPGSTAGFPITGGELLTCSVPILGHGSDRSIITGGSLTLTSGSSTDLGALDGDVDTGSTPYSFVLVTAAPAAVEEGSIIILHDETAGSYYDGNGHQYNNGEAVYVAALSANRKTIYTVMPLRFNYTAATTAVSLIPKFAARCEGIGVAGDGAGHYAAAIRLLYAGPGSRVQGVAGYNTDYAGIEFQNCYGFKVSNMWARKPLADPASGPYAGQSYGQVISNCADLVLSGLDAVGSRHACTMGSVTQTNPLAMINTNILVTDSTFMHLPGSATPISAVDIHGCSERSGYRGCRIDGGAQFGGHDTFYENCRIRSGTGFGVTGQVFVAPEMATFQHRIENCDILYVGKAPSAGYGQIFDIGGPGVGYLDSATVSGGEFRIANNRVRYHVDGAAGENTYIGIVRNRGCTAPDLRLSVIGNEFICEGTDADACGRWLVLADSGSDFDRIEWNDNRGHYACDFRDAAVVNVSRADLYSAVNSFTAGATDNFAISGITSEVNLTGITGRGGAQAMINLSSCSGASVAILGAMQRGNYGADAIQVATAATVVLDGWDLSGTNADINIASSITTIRHGRGYQSGTIALTATNMVPIGVSAFSAHKNGTTQSSITNGTPVKVTFTTEAFDIGGYYDAANSKWTPPAGLVELAATVRVNAGMTLPASLQLLIYKNGSLYKRRDADAVTAGLCVTTIEVIDQANGSDYYEVYVNASDASTGDKTISGVATVTYFQGKTI